jgi:hypothetical protein
MSSLWRHRENCRETRAGNFLLIEQEIRTFFFFVI